MTNIEEVKTMTIDEIMNHPNCRVSAYGDLAGEETTEDN